MPLGISYVSNLSANPAALMPDSFSSLARCFPGWIVMTVAIVFSAASSDTLKPILGDQSE